MRVAPALRLRERRLERRLSFRLHRVLRHRLIPRCRPEEALGALGT